MIKPQFDYILCEEIKPDTGVVTTRNADDSWQKYRVLDVGPGRMENGHLYEVPDAIRKDTVIYVQKHAEADTPPELVKINQALIMASRVMAVEV